MQRLLYGASGTPSRAQAPPPEMQHTVAIKNDINVRRGSVTFERTDDGQLGVSFEADIRRPCRVVVFVDAVETVNEKNVTTR